MTAANYLVQFSMPNFYFHVTTRARPRFPSLRSPSSITRADASERASSGGRPRGRFPSSDPGGDELRRYCRPAGSFSAEPLASDTRG
jgi:hypothetical protein